MNGFYKDLDIPLRISHMQGSQLCVFIIVSSNKIDCLLTQSPVFKLLELNQSTHLIRSSGVAP